MNRYLFKMGTIFLIFFTFANSHLTFGNDKDIVKIQGMVMLVDLKNKMMVVNERTLKWNENTIFSNEKGTTIAEDKIKNKTWVYIEGMKENSYKNIVIKKIYLLPKYIHEKEKHLYSFME